MMRPDKPSPVVGTAFPAGALGRGGSPTASEALRQVWSDPMLRTIVIVAAFVRPLPVVALLARGAPVLLAVVPWFGPMLNGFLVMVSACVTFLAFGRHRVLGDSASFWVGIGFSAFAAGMLYNVLTWPALLPDGRSNLGQASNTAA